MGELVNQYSSSLVVTEQNYSQSSGLASNLWQGLQVAVITAVSHIDLLESANMAVQGISKSITMPTTSMARVLDDTGMLLMSNGRISLNMDCMGNMG